MAITVTTSMNLSPSTVQTGQIASRPLARVKNLDLELGRRFSEFHVLACPRSLSTHTYFWQAIIGLMTRILLELKMATACRASFLQEIDSQRLS